MATTIIHWDAKAIQVSIASGIGGNGEETRTVAVFDDGTIREWQPDGTWLVIYSITSYKEATK